MFAYVDRIASESQRSNAWLDRLVQPVLEILSHGRNAIGPQVLLAHFHLDREQFAHHLAFGSAVHDAPILAVTKRGAPLAIGLSSIDGAFAQFGTAQRSSSHRLSVVDGVD